MSEVAKATPLVPRRSARPQPLYEQLRRGLRAGGVSREAIFANQRERLYGAMVATVGELGYTHTTVRRVSALAGVSTRTFYDRFGSRQGCFLATYDAVIGRAVQRIQAAYVEEGDPKLRLCRAFEQFAREAVDDPYTARFALVEVLGVGRPALAHMQASRDGFERMIAASTTREGMTLPPTILRGIVGGVERVAQMQLLDGRIEQLIGRAQELSTWVSAYEPHGARLLRTGCSVLPHPPAGQLSLPTVRGENPGLRMLRAANAIAGTSGYESLTVGAIAEIAGVPARTFADLYGPGGVEECFLAAVDLVGLQALLASSRASRGAEDWPTSVHRAMSALMDHIAANPILARVAFIEVFCVGAAAVERRSRLLGKFTDVLMRYAPEPQRISRGIAEAIVGGVWEVAHHHVARGETQLLPGLCDQVSYIALAPVIGSEAALETILSQPAPPSSAPVASDLVDVI